MKSALEQYDLFEGDQVSRRIARPLPVKSRKGTLPIDPQEAEKLASSLESTGNYRILRKLNVRTLINREDSPYERLAVIVDTETTGLLHSVDDVIEIGAIAFTYNDQGEIGDLVGVFSALQQPRLPIPPEITRITGITDEMVAGQCIDIPALEAIVEDADLVIAHHAAFDRPFCEKLTPVFVSKPWACSVSEIDWAGRGFEGSKLGYLVGQSGLFHVGHRAADDCHALLEVISRPEEVGGGTPFAELLETSGKSRVRIYAENTPYDMKDQLKGRSYRWSDGSDGRPKSWWIEVDEDEYDEELKFLRTDIYRWQDADPLTIRLTASERFRP